MATLSLSGTPLPADADRKEEFDQIDKASADQAPTQAERVTSAYADWTTKQTVRTFWRLYAIGFAVSVSGMYLGYTLSLPGSIVANRGFIAQFGTVVVNGQLQLDAQYVGLWNAINFVSQVIFQMISPFSAERFGLKFNLYTFTFFILLAIIVEIVAMNWWHYLIAKILGGFAAGFIGTSIMSYVSEITMPRMRGAHLSAFAFFFALGQVASAIALEVLEQTSPWEFRRAFYSEFAILGVWAPILVLLPESPAWLYKKGRHDDARKSLRKLIGNVEGYDWDREYAVMAQELDDSAELTRKSSALGIKACFKGTNLRRTLISTVPFSMQNFVGGPLMFNVTYFFSLIGFENAFQSNVIVLCVLMACVLISFYLVDKVGRRPLLLGGGAVMSVCVLVVGIIGTQPLSNSLASVMVAVVCLWVIAYALSCAPIGWLCLVELSTPMLRTQTAGIAAVLQSCSGVVFNYTVPLMLSDQYAGWGAKIGFFFCGLASLFTVLVWFTVPETKGLSYSEIDILFSKRIPAWRFKQAAAELHREGEGAE